MTFRLIVACFVAALLVAPAVASEDLDATIRVAEGYYPVTGASGPYTYASEPCAVKVTSDQANAYGLLVAAQNAKCISSFQVIQKPPYGHYLTCVSGRCESLGFYWAIYQNGALTCAGLDDIPVHPKDELAFSYETYPTALALASCPPGA